MCMCVFADPSTRFCSLPPKHMPHVNQVVEVAAAHCAPPPPPPPPHTWSRSVAVSRECRDAASAALRCAASSEALSAVTCRCGHVCVCVCGRVWQRAS